METIERSTKFELPGPGIAVDGSGQSFLIISFGGGENAALARMWLNEAITIGPVQWLTFTTFNPEARRQLFRSLLSTRNGVRVMVVGTRFDVLQTGAVARSAGALEQEIRSVQTDISSLPIYCAHCRHTSPVTGGAGDVVTCPACARRLEIHPHISTFRGSYLASNALAQEAP